MREFILFVFMRTIKVRVKFYPNKRSSFPPLNCGYRPHFVINGDTELLGVEFLKSDLTEFNQFGGAIVKLLYDTVDYSKLTKGTEFTIVEGSLIVGEGSVLD